MDTKFQTSFIPKKPIIEDNKAKAGISLFLLVSIIIFLVSVGLAAWVYITKSKLIEKIADVKEEITKKNDSLRDSQVFIEKIIQINSRIEASKEILSKHTTVYPIFFKFLQSSTLKNVRFNSFSFTSNGKDENQQESVRIILSGQATSWRVLASQADEFNKPDYKGILNDVKISNLALTPSGSVTFSLTASFNPDFVIYKGDDLSNEAVNQ